MKLAAPKLDIEIAHTLPPPLGVGLRQKGWFILRQLGRDGRPVAPDRRLDNAATYQGLNLLQNVMFKGATQVTTWYLTLINASGYSAVSASDTHASHAGWTEFTDFSGSRPAWTPGTPSSGALASSGATDFTISSDGDIRGIAVVSLDTKGSTDGGEYLWATALAGAAVEVANGQTLEVFYTNTFTPVS